MVRGLLWLPLLVIFIGLAWAGWNESQKVEAYRQWAVQFDRAKYDIYAVLGQKGKALTWGKPTRQGPLNLETFSLEEVRQIRVLVNEQPLDLEQPTPAHGAIALEFLLKTGDRPIRVPFTEVSLATQWAQVLTQDLESLS